MPCSRVIRIHRRGIAGPHLLTVEQFGVFSNKRLELVFQ